MGKGNNGGRKEADNKRDLCVGKTGKEVDVTRENEWMDEWMNCAVGACGYSKDTQTEQTDRRESARVVGGGGKRGPSMDSCFFFFSSSSS